MDVNDVSRPTLAEVARRAGVGRSSAARVLGNYGSVSEHTRARVLEAAEELGYEANALARSMSTGQTMTLGVVLADISNPFFAAVFRGISDAARSAGYGTLIVNSDESPDRENEAVRLLLGKQVDGIIVAPAGGVGSGAPALRSAVERGVPVVQVDRTLRDLKSDSVVMDNRDAARLATETLISKGHRNIALGWGPFCGGETDVSAEQLFTRARTTEISSVGERFLGYAEALGSADIILDPRLVMTGRQDISGVRSFFSRVWEDCAPTAVIATELDAVVGVLAEAKISGLKLPDDVSLIGFDDSPWEEVFDPSITIVKQPVQALGKRAVDLLLERLGGSSGPPRIEHLASRLVLLDSVSAPSR